jgi:hypothetical protein
MSEIGNKRFFRGIGRWVIKLAPSIIFVAGFLMAIHYTKQHSPNRDDARLIELRRIVADTPVYPGFIETATHESSKAYDAGVFITYRSEAEYEAVRNYYISSLKSGNWYLAKEENNPLSTESGTRHSLEFRRGELKIIIDNPNLHSTMNQWNYSVSFLWHRQ